MRPIQFHPELLTDPDAQNWWADWLKRAESATRNAITAWEEWYVSNPRPTKFNPGLNQQIWSDLKAWLATHVFHRKCAYCEAPLDSDRYQGDAEHFRPKGRVTVNSAAHERSVVHVTLPDGARIEHPGYFWLAYHWKNLVPACAFCNSGKGKVDQFPTTRSHVFFPIVAADAVLEDTVLTSKQPPGLQLLGPSDLDALEEPLLLNPLNPTSQRDPRKHLRFGLGGIVVALDDSPVGLESIRVYQLDREDLNTRRQEAQENIHYAYFGALQEPGVDLQQKIRRKLQPYVNGEKDYSTAALDYLEEVRRAQDEATESALAGG